MKSEGVLSLWRGISVDLIRYVPVRLFNMVVNQHTFKRLFPFTREKHGYWIWFMGTMLAGALPGFLSLAIVYPLDFARTVLAADVLSPTTNSYEFENLVDVIRKTVKKEGFHRRQTLTVSR